MKKYIHIITTISNDKRKVFDDGLLVISVADYINKSLIKIMTSDEQLVGFYNIDSLVSIETMTAVKEKNNE